MSLIRSTVVRKPLRKAGETVSFVSDANLATLATAALANVNPVAVTRLITDKTRFPFKLKARNGALANIL